MPESPSDLAGRVLKHFTAVHLEVFLGDPVCNPKLRVEVLEEALAHDTPTLVLITPWTINGLAFPPDGTLPDTLTVNRRSLPVFVTDIAGIGVVHSVNLVANTATLASPEAARSAARALSGDFRHAITRAREAAQVADPGRRELFRIRTHRDE